METIQTESCSTCHPFYTGQKRILDTTGRVERFEERVKKAQEQKAVRKEKKSRPEVKKLG
jgi:large subunit ribosomal protein L31